MMMSLCAAAGAGNLLLGQASNTRLAGPPPAMAWVDTV